MTRLSEPKQVSTYLLKKGDVFMYGFPQEEWIFEKHRQKRTVAKKISDGKSYLVRILQSKTVTVVGYEKPNDPVHTKVLAKPGELTSGDLFVIVKKQAELFRFVKYGTKSNIINAKSVIDGKSIKLTGFDVIKVVDLPF